MTDSEGAGEAQPQPQIIIEPDKMAGVWSNYATVAHSPFEFTLDFIRLDFTQDPPNGIVVARVSLSPLLVSQLIDALSENWAKYTQRAMPPEVYRDGGTEGDGEEPGASS